MLKLSNNFYCVHTDYTYIHIYMQAYIYILLIPVGVSTVLCKDVIICYACEKIRTFPSKYDKFCLLRLAMLITFAVTLKRRVEVIRTNFEQAMLPPLPRFTYEKRIALRVGKTIFVLNFFLFQQTKLL